MRSFWDFYAKDTAGNVIANAKVYLYAQGTGVATDPPSGTAITGSVYSAATGGSALTFPRTTDTNGKVTLWFATAQDLDVVMTDNDGTAYKPPLGAATLSFDPRLITSSVSENAANLATDAEVTAAVSAHAVDTTVVHGITDTAQIPFKDTANVWTANQKFQWGPLYDVRAWGAIGDGLTHPLSASFASLAAAQVVYPHATALTNELDWCAIQGAMNAAIGAIVYFPNGVYLVHTSLDIPTGRVLRGDGPKSSTIRATAAFSPNDRDHPILRQDTWIVDSDATATKRVFISNLVVDCANIAVGGLGFSTQQPSFVEHFRVDDAKFYGIAIGQGTQQCHFTNIQIVRGGEHAVWIRGAQFLYFYDLDPEQSKTTHMLLDGYDRAAAPVLVEGAGAGSLAAGTYKYAVVFEYAAGIASTGVGAEATITVGANAKVDLSAITRHGVDPLIDGAIPQYVAPGTKRRIYRTDVGGSTLKLIGTVADDFTTTFADTGVAGGASKTHIIATNSSIGVWGMHCEQTGRNAAVHVKLGNSLQFDTVRFSAVNDDVFLKIDAGANGNGAEFTITNLTGNGGVLLEDDVRGWSETPTEFFGAATLAGDILTLSGATTALTAAVEVGAVATFTTAVAHGFATGDSVVVAGVTPAGFNGRWYVTATPTVTTFTATLPTLGLGTASALGTAVAVFTQDDIGKRIVQELSPRVNIIAASQVGSISTYTTDVPHGLTVGQTVKVDGIVPLGYNDVRAVGTTPTTTSFAFGTGSPWVSMAPATEFGKVAWVNYAWIRGVLSDFVAQVVSHVPQTAQTLVRKNGIDLRGNFATGVQMVTGSGSKDVISDLPVWGSAVLGTKKARVVQSVKNASGSMFDVRPAADRVVANQPQEVFRDMYGDIRSKRRGDGIPVFPKKAGAWTAAELGEVAAYGYDSTNEQLNIRKTDGTIGAVGDASSRAPNTADYLVGSAQTGLTSEVVVGTTPQGELGGTWASPTVDATHADATTHASRQAAAEATAAAAAAAHVAAADPHGQYVEKAYTLQPELTGLAHRFVRGSLTGTIATLYEVPAGKKALVAGFIVQNPTGGALIPNLHYVASAGSADATNMVYGQSLAAAAEAAPFTSALLGAGATIQALGNGLSVQFRVLEFADTVPLVGAHLGNIPATDTLFYTCPASKTARLFGLNDLIGVGAVGFNNNVAASVVTVKTDRAGTKMLIQDSSTAAATALAAASGLVAASLEAEDAIYLSASVTNTNIWACYHEVPV